MTPALGVPRSRSQRQRRRTSRRRQAIARKDSSRVRPPALAFIASATVLAALILIFRFSAEAPTLRATIETALVLSGLVSAWLLWLRSTRTRHVSDFLVLSAVLTLTLSQFAFLAAPAMLGSRSSDYEAAVPLIAHLEVAVMFAAAALARTSIVATRQEATVLLGTPVAAAAAAALGALILDGGSSWFAPAHAGSMPTAHAVALTVPGVVLMLVAAVGFARRVIRQPTMMVGMLGAAVVLLTAAWSYWLLVPGLTANSVSGRECVCAGAFALILLLAFLSHTQMQRARAAEAAATERRRLVDDLHDGMAQDLAFIATYADHLVQDFGPEHPLTVAARRALAASRGVIADLSASDAPNAAAALQAVARELSSRHNVSITVDAEGEDMTARTREAVVRIAREAVVNAVQHGQARHIAVSLETRGDELKLRISDDGRRLEQGLSADPHRGLGLPAMRERAEAIGGELIVDTQSDGGTAVEAVVS